MIPRNLERLGGLLIASVGAWLTHMVWQVAHEQSHFMAAGAAGPGFVLLGVASIAFPGYRSERLARGESLEGLEGWALLTPRWKVVTILSMALAVGYFLVLSYGL